MSAQRAGLLQCLLSVLTRRRSLSASEACRRSGLSLGSGPKTLPSASRR